MKPASRLGSRAGRLFSSARTALAVQAAQLATAASRATGRGAGGMIGGLVAGAIDPSLMDNLAASRPVALVTGTNGKSTTTRMLAAAARTLAPVCTNEGGDNMDAGIISALLAGRDKQLVVLEVDELHVPRAGERLGAQVLVLLNLSRDQLDRVGEINTIERRLREYVNAHPELIVVANCDDVMTTSVAFDAPRVIWVAAGAGWTGDSTSCPRTESHIVREGDHWYATKPLADGRRFERPTPQLWLRDLAGQALQPGTAAAAGSPVRLHSSAAEPTELQLALPGQANRGNAALALAGFAALLAVVNGQDPAQLPGLGELAAASRAVGEVASVAGRYATISYGPHQVHMLLAKNPAGWQEALSMVDRSAEGLVIAVNGQVADGEDLSWLWDVRFEDFGSVAVKAAGERGTDLAVRLTYAEIQHELIADTLAAIAACPPGRVEVLANYTAFRDLKRALERANLQEDSDA